LFFVTEADGNGDPTRVRPGRSKLEEFRLMAKLILAEKKEYSEAFDLQTAYRQLRHMVKHPITYQNKQKHQAYAQSTESRGYRSYVKKPSFDKSREVEPPKAEIDYISEELNRMLTA
jgi:hypothetical protein